MFANGKITKPISLTDIANAVKSNSRSLTDLIRYGTINKWAKCKPINYPTTVGITDAQRKGTFADNANGIFYGVKGASVAGAIDKLHEATYEYYRPTGGANSPYRAGDFDGYDVKARPTLYCSAAPTEVYYNVNGSLSVAINYDYNGTNTTGIDVNDFLPANEAKNIGDYYPCVLVDGWCRALYNVTATGGGSTKVYTPLKYGNVWYYNFATDIDIAALQTTVTRKVTFFLIRAIEGATMPNSLKQWQNVSDLVSNERGYVVPEGVALQIPFKRYSTVTNISNIDVAQIGVGSNSSIQVSWNFPDGPPANKTKFNVSLQVWDGNGSSMFGVAEQDWVYRDNVITMLPAFLASSLGLNMLFRDTLIKCKVTITEYQTETSLYPESFRADKNITFKVR